MKGKQIISVTIFIIFSDLWILFFLVSLCFFFQNES
jgi:hypothetical protein